MGWGTFIAGRALSSFNRGLTRDEIRQLEKNSAMEEEDNQERREEFVDFVVTESVLGHPEIRNAINIQDWIDLTVRKSFYFFNTAATLFYMLTAGMITIFLGTVMNLDEFDDYSTGKTFSVMAFLFLMWLCIYFRIRNNYVRRFFAAWVNRNFRKQGWDTQVLLREMRIEKNPDYEDLESKRFRTRRTSWRDFKKATLQAMANGDVKRAAKKDRKSALFPDKPPKQ